MIDLHCHSTYSDGSDEPSELLNTAVKIGLEIISMTDHDNINGLSSFFTAAQKLDICAISGIEMDVECTSIDVDYDVHVLGYAFDYKSEIIKNLLARQAVRREKRNAELIKKLNDIGVSIRIQAPEEGKIISLVHIANEIIKAGFAHDISDVFEKYLGLRGAARINVKKIKASEFVNAIHACGGVCVLAHPFKIIGGYDKIFDELKGYGLDGIEVYYPTHTLLEVHELRKLAVNNDLMITCGSDYHGSNRKEISLGEVSRIAESDHMIAETLKFFKNK